MDSIYLDHAATTPVRDEVRDAMNATLSRTFGNPSSVHRWGREASAALEEARETCARALGARPSEIFFVRGGTEADNLAVMGRAARLRGEGHTPAVVTTTIEHKAVLDAARHATARGAGRWVHVDVGTDGRPDMEALDAALRDGPAVVSMMWVNNETGTVLPVSELAERAGRAGATFHTDAVQAVGKVPVRVDEVPVDLLSLTGHKIYGPRGNGLLFARSGVHVAPILHGGGQERGLRPGTEDVAGAVGLATAVRLAVEEQEAEATRVGHLRDTLEERLLSGIEGVRVNGGRGPRAPHVSSLAFLGVDGAALLMALDMERIGASGGAACDSGANTGSHVISALYGADDPHAIVRFSLGRLTTEEHVRAAAERTIAVVQRLRAAESAS